MAKTSSVIELVTSKSKLETRNKLTSLEVRERALAIGTGLVTTQKPNDMTGFYCKAFRVLGESRYSAVAKACRAPEVEKPKHLFPWLLKEEMVARGYGAR